MVIRWTPLAKNSLRDIYLFYLPQTGKKKALEIVTETRNETIYLLTFPEIGMIEEIEGEKTSHRYLLKKHIKIYYTIKKQYIRIDFVWDTRRDPAYLRNILV